MPLMLGAALLLQSGCVAPGPPGLPPPPVPVVEFDAEPPPFPGAVWVGGSWGWHEPHRRYEWHHGYWRH